MDWEISFKFGFSKKNWVPILVLVSNIKFGFGLEKT
jgi:hypothetical protein